MSYHPPAMRYALMMLLLVACGGNRAESKSAGTKDKFAPFHSTVPCAEACGNDPRCNSSCLPVDTNAPPPGARRR